MPQFNAMIFPFILILISINAMFFFTTQLPENELSSTTLNMGLTQTQITNLQGSVVGFGNELNTLSPPSTGSVDATTQNKSYFDNFKDWLYGAVTSIPIIGEGVKFAASTFGLVTQLLGYMYGMIFGYMTWVDYLLNPSWGAGFVALGWLFKGFFFIIEMLGIYQVVVSIFAIGTGTRYFGGI